MTNSSHPKIFISHSSANKNIFVLNFIDALGKR